MSLVSAELLKELVAEVRLAPSVHNIQPTRWRRAPDDELLLLWDVTRRLPAADPNGHDVALSHGAALEGMEIALNRRGLALVSIRPEQELGGRLRPLMRLRIGAGGKAPALGAFVNERVSWRGSFAVASSTSRAATAMLARSRDDLVLFEDEPTIRSIAMDADRANMHFVQETSYRAELVAWMRFTQAHPDYARNGLNREAMALGAAEAAAARLILGPLFPPLHKLGLAASLLAEQGRTASAAALAVFHRPEGEDAYETGRHFYRAWLTIQSHGLSACPISVLADHRESKARIAMLARLEAGRRVVNVFRIGIPGRPPLKVHFREAVDDLIA